MPPNRRLRERVPAQSAMARVVAAQAAAPARTPIGTVLGVSPLRAQARADYRAALAELSVGDALDNLGQRWDVLHDLPLRDGALDHLAIGPAGVFAVRTVHCDGLDAALDSAGLTVGGEPSDDVARARADAEEVADRLGDASGERIRVRPLLVLVDARRFTTRSLAPAVRIVVVQELVRVLTKAPGTLDGDRVAA
ncbi:MAG: nuclease-related domain-containing protein, partial [Rhodoglobus sp.]